MIWKILALDDGKGMRVLLWATRERKCNTSIDREYFQADFPEVAPVNFGHDVLM